MSQFEFFGLYGPRGPRLRPLGALFARIYNCGAKVLFEAAAGRFFLVIGGNIVLYRSAYALGYSLVELFKRAQFRVDVGLAPALEELNRGFGHLALSQRAPII